MLDIFASFFGNIFNIVMIAVFLLVGIMLGILLKPWFGNQVVKLIPGDHRFIDFDIQEETSTAIYCKAKKGYPVQRFIKMYPGYTGVLGSIIKKPITRYFGKEGTAYTWIMKAGNTVKVGGISEALKTVVGETFYDQIPDKQKSMIEESKVNVTVDLEAGFIPQFADSEGKPFKVISEENIKQEEDRQAAKTYWEGKKTADSHAWVNLVLAAMAGFGIACALILLGILKMPTAPAPEPAQTSTTALIESAKTIIALMKAR